MNKEKLRMSFLAGLITEGEYKQKLGENEDKDFIKSEMERLISKVSNNSEIPEEEKIQRINDIKFVIYDFLDPETRGGKRPPIGFKFDNRWWSSVKSLDPIVYQDALSELLSAARGSDSFNMDEKQDLNENFVGIGAINNPFPTRKKSDYELAFEHFTRGEVNEEEGNPFKMGSNINTIEELEQALKSMFPNSQVTLNYDEEGDGVYIDGIYVSEGAYQKWDTYNEDTDEEKSFTNDKDLISFLKGGLNEEDSMGKIGKQYAAPSTPTPIKNIQRIISDVDRKKVFLGKSNDPEYQNKMMIYFDDKDPFYSPLKKYVESEDSEYSKDGVSCLTRLSTMYPFLQPISQNPNVTPLKLNLINLNGLLAGLRSIITLRKCPDYMNDEDGQYILIEPEELQGYISLGNVGGGLRKGTNYDLGKGFIFTTVDFD
jgi:hypothetical protein